MAKIPRVNQGDRPSAAPNASPVNPRAIAGDLASVGQVFETGTAIAADVEKQEALRLKDIAEKKQAIGNVVGIGHRLGNLNATLRESMEAIKVESEPNPEKAIPKFVELAREFSKREIDSAASDDNGEIALGVAQGANSQIESLTNELRAWEIRQKTQKIRGQLEDQKNLIAVDAGQMLSVEQLDGFLSTAHRKLYPQFVAVYGPDAGKEWHDASVRATDSYVRVQGDVNPVGVREELRSPKGAVALYLKSTERDSLLQRTERAIEKRGETRQFDLLGEAAGETVKAVSLLNSGGLDGAEGAKVMIALRERNAEAQKKAAIDPSFTPEQRQEQVSFLKRQGEVLRAVNDIRTRSLKFDPQRQSVNDRAAIVNSQKELQRFKGRKEQLPLLVEQMQRLTLARDSGEISPAGYAAAFGVVGLAYEKSLTDEADNDGFWIFQNSREAGNREMTRLVETIGQKVDEEKKDNAWTTYMARYLEAAKKGNVTKEEARRIVRESFSFETGKEARLRGER